MILSSQMTEEDKKKQLKQQIYSILKSVQPAQAIPPLFQIEVTLPENMQSLVRQPILFVFENQHDWDSIMKCLKNWNEMHNWVRGFYDRMKKRFHQTPSTNLADHQLMPEISKLIDRHQAQFENRKPLVPNIEKYFKKEEEDKNSNTVKSGRSIKSIQSIRSIQSVKSNPVAPSKLINESVQPPKTVQYVQQPKSVQSSQIPNKQSVQSIKSVQSVQSVQPSNSVQSAQTNQDVKSNIQSVPPAQPLKATHSLQNATLSTEGKQRKTEFPKPEMPKMSKISRMTEHNGPQRSNSKSTSSNPGARNFNMIKKPNIPMFRKDGKEENSNTVANPVNKNHKRLTFGISDELRGNLRLAAKNTLDLQKKNQVNQAKPPNKIQQKPQKNQNVNLVNSKTQEAPKEISKQVPKQVEMKQKSDDLHKANVFERKDEISVRVNPIFATQKKELNPNEVQDFQKLHEASLSRSITPNKPLIERKKIVLKKPTDFKPSVVSDEQFEEDDGFNQASLAKQNDDGFFSERKLPSQHGSVQIEEVQELAKEIRNVSQRPTINNLRQNPEKTLENSQKQNWPHQSTKPQQRNDQRKETIQQNIRKHAQVSHSVITRRDDQLFSEYEISLMSFNPNENSTDVNLYNILKKLDLNVTEDHNQMMKNELDEIKRRKAERPRRNKF